MLELKREPEVVFWVFVFPLLLAAGLGIAFRNKPGDASSVAIVAGSGAQEAEALLQRSPQHASIEASVRDADAARKGFRLGKYDLVIEPDGAGRVRYLYDPARPESVLARAQVNDALQAAAGRKDVVATTLVNSSEPGSRYIDFLIPGLLGMNLMNSGILRWWTCGSANCSSVL
jgi:ABC-2 type transport system permease protein